MMPRKCGRLPAAGMPKFVRAGSPFAQATSSLSDLAGTCGPTATPKSKVRELRQRFEVVDRIVVERLVDVLVDRHRRDRRDQQRIAVGRRGLHRLHADASGGAGAVLDDDRAVERGVHLVGDQPREGVARAARRERKDDADRLAADLRVRRGTSVASVPATSADSSVRDGPMA